MQKTQFEPKLREYLLLLSFVPSCALHCFYWVKGRWRYDLILHSLSWRNLPPLRLKSNGEVQSKAKLDMNVKAKKKGSKSVRYCRESFGNYLGRFLLSHSRHCSRSLASSPSTVDRGTLTSWPWNIAACWESLCVWWSDGPLQEFHSKSDRDGGGWLALLGPKLTPLCDVSVVFCGVLQCCVLGYLWISTDHVNIKF